MRIFTMKFLVAFLLLAVSISALKEPSYIKPCYIKKPDFDQCALEHANYAIPFLVQGDKQRDIPVMNPLVVPMVEIIQNDFRLAFSDLEVHGLENITVKEIKLNKTNIDLLLHVDNLVFLGRSEIGGKILFLTLKGSGPANITAVKGDYRFISTLETYTKNAQNFLKFNKPVMVYSLENVIFQFDDLFSGEKGDIGIDVNKILNDNWEGVLQDIDVPLKEAVTTVIENIVSRILKNVPEENIFPE